MLSISLRLWTCLLTCPVGLAPAMPPGELWRIKREKCEEARWSLKRELSARAIPIPQSPPSRPAPALLTSSAGSWQVLHQLPPLLPVPRSPRSPAKAKVHGGGRCQRYKCMWGAGGGTLRGGAREVEAGQPWLGTGQECPDPLPGYLFQPGFLVNSVVDSQQAGSIK